MELRRNRRSLALGVLLLAFGGSLLPGVDSAGIGTWIFVGAALLTGGWITARSLRPFRFRIAAEGLDLKVAGLNRLVSWAEIDAIVLGQAADAGTPSPSLLLVPAGSTIDRPLAGRSPVDGRAALVLLDLADVRQSADEVAAELTRVSGGRFTDARQRRPEGLDEPVFDSALRGYDKRMVDSLVLRGLAARTAGSTAQRQAIRAELDRTGTTLTVALRGYHMGQVDDYLERLSAALADKPA
ncbi:DivIVA domain-containing protein [Micromonospora phaseoli]|uniref:DivIVA domain-containing protein n=1 Tax=Micromonospora phaseoli TaxID=1144548 RepID=A0A1H7CR19_9ACTN|nr:DivIVA domain-containing protein [Micromonospora phaseoli]PZV91620.1 DivIVA domain-containing protein [Micromonospora phaseoli]GIJ79251.1 hypothetical protein Xph01_36830 [Micromonospora phaseoli]SEJ91664.1 DivIVA domain-containing protein [Micromonospora phaseoli]